ncbi:uncharacterized protein F4822DRAFT_293811 [Hypoxylon trugodes]|uniref:uncharacterized protein n=1 Tax=Hypoxylon trugodes TaxID=326681 RepID=UPI0021A00760|nr:uncharacterized protein F4822DRAFT_293811 [Hypoxylon trugodes]KAI1387838.1 hypothetical protein F4822DRAFT_293811 [Hypoxylon trugodes]
MDWQYPEASFDDNHFDNFKYEPRPFKIIRKLSSDGKLLCERIELDESLQRWIEENETSIHRGCEPGAFVIIFSRDYDPVCSSPSHLPVSKKGFGKLIDLFRIHPAIVRTIRREVPYFSRMYCSKGEPDGNSIIYSACTSAEGSNHIGLSSTYLRDRRISLSVFYGCDDEQSSNIEERLTKAGHAIYHPVLTAGILMELDRDRIMRRVQQVNRRSVEGLEALSNTSRDPETILNRDGESTDDLLDLYDAAEGLVKEIKIVKRQLSYMGQHIRELEYAFVPTRKKGKRHRGLVFEKENIARQYAYRNSLNVEMQIRERLVEIGGEYDKGIDDCVMVLNGLKFTTQMASDHVGRQQTFTNTRIANESKKENAQMRTIALVTMVYLPLTSVASIFSMGVFNWEASGKESVLTVWFWLYIAIGGGLTVLTIGSWWVLTQVKRKGNVLTTDAAKIV